MPCFCATLAIKATGWAQPWANHPLFRRRASAKPRKETALTAQKRQVQRGFIILKLFLVRLRGTEEHMDGTPRTPM